jgi:hypothetical protein
MVLATVEAVTSLACWGELDFGRVATPRRGDIPRICDDDGDDFATLLLLLRAATASTPFALARTGVAIEVFGLANVSLF